MQKEFRRYTIRIGFTNQKPEFADKIVREWAAELPKKGPGQLTSTIDRLEADINAAIERAETRIQALVSGAVDVTFDEDL